MPQFTTRTQRGFTIQEMLLVILIMVILLAVSAVGIVTYMRHLQLTELDNSAKEIFMAAQNRAVLLSSNRQLEGLVIQGENQIRDVEVIPGSMETTQITVYYVHSDDLSSAAAGAGGSGIREGLLPVGTIDPTLWDGEFYITYEPESGSVVDVFFSDEGLPVDEEGGFPAFYEKWRAASKDDRMRQDPMIGYYGGESAESGNTISLRTPVINIRNEDTLRAEVTYWVPQTLVLIGEGVNVKLKVTLTYQDQEITLQETDAVRVEGVDISYRSYTYTWTLDSLKPEERFRELFSETGADALTYGDDFTVTAAVSYEPTGETGLKVNGARKRATDNSLFAKDSGGEYAYIACLRHLQNLDTEWSGVSGKTAAVQRGEIAGVEGYLFHPIENDVLQRYDGQDHSISGLNIQSDGAQPAGLFGAFSGTTDAHKTLENIRLSNTAVSAETGPAGALVGEGSYLSVQDCQVFWKKSAQDATDLREILGDNAAGLNYQIKSSGPAGGLAGSLSNSDITGSFAATLVESTNTAAGGLAGQGSGLTVETSYAASYLKGPDAAGLVGDLTGTADILKSYAVGFIDSSAHPHALAAGLCLGGGRATVVSSYSAMLFTAGETITNYPLCQQGSYRGTYYLDSDRFGFAPDDRGVSYAELTDPAKWSMFGTDVFTAKTVAQSHPYNLQTTLALNTFIYPGLAGMDHWGDWGAQFQDGSLVYYEIYQDGSYGFSGGVSHLPGGQPVKEDGYAVAYQSTDEISAIGGVLKVTYQGMEGTEPETFSYGGVGEYPIYEVEDVKGVDEKLSDYFLLPLPGKVVNTDYVAEDFYQEITIEDTRNNTQKSYYYNPHFANTVIRKEDVSSEEELAAMLSEPVQVRSPRHLYMLSRFPGYYASAHQYRFSQALDLDYGCYTGYELFTGEWSQAPIGLDADNPFRGSYYGRNHLITGVVPAAAAGESRYQYVGLFGYNIGVLEDLVYQMQADEDEDEVLSIFQSGSSSKTLYVGALAGYNGGSVENCAAFGVQLQSDSYEYSTIYLGGLVGRNHGSIHNSAVEGAAITANTSMSHAYAGGFVGENSSVGIIERCYAVGKVSATWARYGTVYACGFAGRSDALLSDSYAAVQLMTDGEVQRFGFCPDSSTNCVYLNNGNFTYRKENYAAQYRDDYAAGVAWTALAGETPENPTEELTEQIQAVNALGMGRDAAVYGSGEIYPYPAVVTDGNNQLIHYGQWPERMDLGTMGVYYWEKLEIGETESYHISAIHRGANGQIQKSGTLSTAHGDGGVVTEYGYGYFHQAELPEPVLTSNGIGFSTRQVWNGTEDVPFTTDSAVENEVADDALAALMSEQYEFHSYNTWGTSAVAGQGLFTIQSGQAQRSEPPYGTWTLEGGDLVVRFNPFFADALAVPDEWSVEEKALTALPGTSDNPYEVRSIDQLQFINWNSNARNTIRRMDTDNKIKFPYLCYGTDGVLTVRDFHWEQTHDLKGTTGKTYTPIAGVYDESSDSQGVLFGWFGGTYNGNDYLIADVDIAPYSDDPIDATSCVGLFGAVYNGTLKNIVLYSADGSATVKGTNCGKSRWFSIGALAGVAGSSTGSSVVNCTVAGYTIEDTHRSTSEGGWGGTGLGGLIGVSDMSLVGCTAVTNIVLDSINNDHVRMGGLVGSCQGSINSCYAGGRITVTPKAQAKDMSGKGRPKGIYVGGVVGGIYMKPLKVGGNANHTVGKTAAWEGGEPWLYNSLNNCYTYAELPDADSNQYIRGLYAVGGSGELNPYTGDGNWDHGETSYKNNYYLQSVVLKNNDGQLPTWNYNGNHAIKTDDTDDLNQLNQNVTAMSYSEMADTNPNSGKGLLARLNQGITATNERFSTVTTKTSGDAPLNGRYSFGTSPWLLGRDYPFPTILTQSSSLVDSGRANVHYGDWPVAGIRREERGALPVNLDLFADYKTKDNGAVYTETLTLEGVDTKGSWSVAETAESYDPTIASAELSETTGETNTLSITGLKEGSTIVTVIYTVNDSEYTLDIEVNVTAELRLAAKAQSPLWVFTNEKVQTALELRDQDGKALPAELEEKIALTSFTVDFDPNYFDRAEIQTEAGRILIAESRQETGITQMTVGYGFTYQEEEYTTTSVVTLKLIEPEITLTPLSITFGENADKESKMIVSYNGTDSTIESGEGTCAGGAFALKVNEEEVELPDLNITSVQVDDIYLGTIRAQLVQDEDGTGKIKLEAYYPTQELATAQVQIQFRFDYAGSTHTVWGNLGVQIKKSGAEGEGGGDGTQTGGQP